MSYTKHTFIDPVTGNTEESGFIIRDSDSLVIPVDNDNTDYAEYLEWVAGGNTATTGTPATAEYAKTSDSEVMFTMEVI